MKKTILVCGAIAGAIVSTEMLIGMSYMSHCSGQVGYNTSMLIGYASMLIAFSLVFVGIRRYRDQYNGGAISFGKAFKVGFLIVLVASTMYVGSWLIDNFFFMPDFGEKFAARTLEELKASGASQAVIDKKTAEMASFTQMYRNPIINALITYSEILPMGLIVTFISSLIIKKKAAVTKAE